MNGPGPGPAASKVEAKVRWATLWAYFGSALGMHAVELIARDPVLVTPLPDVVEPFVVALAPALLALLAGIRTRHTPRPDLPLTDGKTPGTR